jgi:hypothetical protein
MKALTYKKTGEGDRTGLVPSVSFLRKGDEQSSGLTHIVIGQGHNLRTFFGASAPVASPQKTGIAHPPATASDARAAFNLNGKSLG